jgi:RNA polymerase sigma-70 factor
VLFKSNGDGTFLISAAASLSSMADLDFDQFFADHRLRLEALHRASGAEQWSVPLEALARAAWQGIAATASAKPHEIPELLGSLRAEDLALALGCAQGNEGAWDTFCSKYRPVLYEAARAFVHEEAQARELADSLLTELYGVDSSATVGPSRFAYFHGRSSLKTWLRAVLYRKFVDEYRRQSRLAPLPDNPDEASTVSSISEQDDRRYDACLSEAVEASLGRLAPSEKLLLSYYYVQELTLKQIGRLTGEHEATISRHLETVRQKLRKRIEAYLRDVKRLTAYEIDRCLDFASRGVAVELNRALKPE